MLPTSVRDLQKSVVNDDLEHAFKGIKSLLPPPFQNEIFTLENRYNEWKKDLHYGIAENFKKHQIQQELSALLEELTQIGEDGTAGFSFSKLVPITKNDIIGEILQKLNKSITIRSPKRNATIEAQCFSAHGKFLLAIPSAFQLWLFQKINGFYYHATLPISLDPKNGQWFQDNIQCKAVGRFELLVCLVSESGARLLQKKIDREDETGFNTLPRGIYEVRSVEVRKG